MAHEAASSTTSIASAPASTSSGGNGVLTVTRGPQTTNANHISTLEPVTTTFPGALLSIDPVSAPTVSAARPPCLESSRPNPDGTAIPQPPTPNAAPKRPAALGGPAPWPRLRKCCNNASPTCPRASGATPPLRVHRSPLLTAILLAGAALFALSFFAAAAAAADVRTTTTAQSPRRM
ncbi:hypothetical protein B0J12DRAFT_738012 [Macrophomina phaseolina]|uniref:Uncharacterized protein n=1 Tax=Macrophomina phaseolina TaxID=35725 RepID=A0ABQ8GJE5_9PEZI|nr:hypothetical protein B0J12DRAFT_738012 [Macrophomina phaseolina]